MIDDNERARRTRLNRAIVRTKKLSWERGTTVYIVKHGRWRYRVTETLPKNPQSLVLWSKNGD